MTFQSPIACDLSAIGEAELEKHRENAAEVFEAINEIRETETGYAFKLAADSGLIQRIAAFIARERLCCPFLEFTLTIPPDHKPVWLKLTGRDEIKPYLEETLLSQLSSSVRN